MKPRHRRTRPRSPPRPDEAAQPAGQPTTAEIEEALRLVRPIEVTLRAWMSSRRLNTAKAAGTAQFTEDHPRWRLRCRAQAGGGGGWLR